jgi:hypothetical protein
MIFLNLVGNVKKSWKYQKYLKKEHLKPMYPPVSEMPKKYYLGQKLYN